MQEIEETRRIALGEMGLILPQVVAVGAQTQKVAWTRARLYPKQGARDLRLYGEDVYGAVIDEASRMKEDAWTAIQSTLTATRGPVRIIGNVKGEKN